MRSPLYRLCQFLVTSGLHISAATSALSCLLFRGISAVCCVLRYPSSHSPHTGSSALPKGVTRAHQWTPHVAASSLQGVLSPLRPTKHAVYPPNNGDAAPATGGGIHPYPSPADRKRIRQENIRPKNYAEVRRTYYQGVVLPTLPPMPPRGSQGQSLIPQTPGQGPCRTQRTQAASSQSHMEKSLGTVCGNSMKPASQRQMQPLVQNATNNNAPQGPLAPRQTPYRGPQPDLNPLWITENGLIRLPRLDPALAHRQGHPPTLPSITSLLHAVPRPNLAREAPHANHRGLQQLDGCYGANSSHHTTSSYQYGSSAFDAGNMRERDRK
ncbi:hypothetical protein EV426DRAFT_572408 [Tirmania nivea]|nr:hypothetical protein EV426DRAFT_572408 [Tirmania nivea]